MALMITDAKHNKGQSFVTASAHSHYYKQVTQQGPLCVVIEDSECTLMSGCLTRCFMDD